MVNLPFPPSAPVGSILALPARRVITRPRDSAALNIQIVERCDPRIREVVASVADSVWARLASVTEDIQDVIVDAVPGIKRDDSAALFRASVAENVGVALRMLGDPARDDTMVAPPAAVEYARRLAQQQVPQTALIRAYRVGLTRFLDHAIRELLRQTPGDHLEGLAILEITNTASDYVDRVVEQALAAYTTARDTWLTDRSALLAMRIGDLIRGEQVDVPAIERAIDYRIDQHHVGLILWLEESSTVDALAHIRGLVSNLAESLGLARPALIVPSDEKTVWAWIPTGARLAGSPEVVLALKKEHGVAVALGEPGLGINGFRRTHRQATSAKAVAVAAGAEGAAVTPFVDVAPIAALCSDLPSARAWVHETLGGLAAESARIETLRETVRVFLQTGGSYTATAEQLALHRNTTQYRVHKAEEIRGRPFREGRLDVELALLACQWLRRAVLQPGD